MTRFHPLLTRLGSRPLAIAPRALDGLLAAGPLLDAGPRLDPRQAMFAARDAPLGASHAVTDAGIAVVPILGPLVTRGDWLTSFLGASDYGEIAAAVEAALADPSARAVLLELDSPGGEVGGLFDLVDRLVSLREAAGKPLWAVASESALSAAFAIASVADRLYLTRTAEIGSVGVVAIHVDESAADRDAGQNWTLIHAGARKIDGNPHEPLSDGAHTAIRADVEALYGDLVSLVANNRRMTPESVRATEAAIYRGARGVTAGFADQIGTFGDAIRDLARFIGPRSSAVLRTGARSAAPMPATRMPATRMPATRMPATPILQSSRRETIMTTDTVPDPSTAGPENLPAADDEQPGDRSTPSMTPPPPETPLPITPLPATPPAPASPDAAAEAGRLRAEYAEIAAIAAQGGRLGVTIDAADAMAKGIAPASLRRTILDTLAARAEASAVVAVAPVATGDSPIVRRARERAAANHTSQ